MKKLKITKGNGWYKNQVGTVLDIKQELRSKYLVGEDIEQGNYFYVDKEDCTIFDEDFLEGVEEELLIKLIPNSEGKCVDFPVKLEQGDWIDLRVLNGALLSICNTISETKGYPLLERNATKVVLKWRKGTFEGKEVLYTNYDKGDFMLLDLGTAKKMPKGYEAYVIPRSSTFKNTGLIQTNSFGLIDNSYNSDTDVWKMPVYALEDGFIIQNERICQFRIQKNQPTLKLTQVDSLEGINRGGFGEGTKNEKYGNKTV